jgi:hypothetical protein
MVSKGKTADGNELSSPALAFRLNVAGRTPDKREQIWRRVNCTESLLSKGRDATASGSLTISTQCAIAKERKTETEV